MKGVVFTEFLEMVEDKFSPEVADKIIEASHTETGGAYTSVGTYHHAELIEMVVNLSKISGLDSALLIKTFGEYLFSSFVKLYPEFFTNTTSCFPFLELIDNHVHCEVRKLYPDAELPTFKTHKPNNNTLVMTYHSERPFAPLAEGLICGAICYFQEKIDLKISDLSGGENTHVEFTLSAH
ncbi:MAG: heme NO-binding domain-containing protein [Thiotrichaceae bacterium]|nr:heme NO-binding domain-containing protein [Thiotrichaceae bacterium]